MTSATVANTTTAVVATSAQVEVEGVDVAPWLTEPDTILTGECELLDGDIGGIAVHIAPRILGHAGAGEIPVSRTVRDLVVGSGTGFVDRSVELRGVPGTWQLLAVDRHGPRAGSAEAELASTPTPGPRTAMRRSDRAMEVIGEARTVDSPRDGPPRPAHRPPLNSRRSNTQRPRPRPRPD